MPKNNSQASVERLIGFEELATLIPLAKITLRRYVAHGRIPSLKIGSRTFFRQSEIEAWLDKHSRGGE